MADYRVVDREQLDADMTDVADHIRAKAQISTPLEWPDGYKAAVDAISTGVELPELTNPGDASKLLAGYQLIDGDGAVVDGNIPTVDAATPGLTIQANGDVVAYVDQAAGYTAGGYKTYKQSQDVMPAQTITPGTEDQVIPAYHYLTGKQTIKGDPNLIPENIPEDLTLFGVQGERKLSNVEPPDSLALDPDVVYATTRPKDWLPMPTPGDDETYLLGHIIPGIEPKLAIMVMGTILVEIGRLENGEFVAKDQFTPTAGTSVVHNINPDDFGDETATGEKQYLVRLTGSGNYVSFSGNDAKYNQILDCISGAVRYLSFGETSDLSKCMHSLRYLRFVGNGRPISTQGMVSGVAGIMSVSCEQTETPQYYTYGFYSCVSLLAVSPTLTTKIGSSSFTNCYSLHSQPVSNGTEDNLSNAFRSTGILRLDGSGFGKVASMQNIVYYCYCLECIDNLNISSLIQISNNSFAGCSQLRRVTFAGETTPGGVTFDFNNKPIAHSAAVDMINSLPVATTAATIVLTGTPAASELTEAEIAIATAKNWTITI